MGRKSKRHRFTIMHDQHIQREVGAYTRECAAIGLPVAELWHVKAWKEKCASARGANSQKYIKAVATRQGRGLPVPRETSGEHDEAD